MSKIEMTATFGTCRWEGEDEHPIITHGFTDPHNPWGGFRYEMPDGCVGEAATAWMAENVETVEFSDLREAAQFADDFPGGVWDYRESEHEMIDYGTGLEMEVTLHVKGDDDNVAAVFALADRLKADADKATAMARNRI